MSNITIEELIVKHNAAKEERKGAKERLDERAVRMAELRYVQGLTLAAIGKQYGLSRERVRQIIEELLTTK